MTELSPAAQAVLDATGRKTWWRNDDIAAALRAAADCLTDATSAHTLYAIADELEAND
jgi:hypothetical protein